MNPQIASQYVNIPLTNYSIEKRPANMLADVIAPVLPVDKDSGIYFEYGQEDFDVSGSDIRSPGTEAGIEGYTLKQNTYGPLADHSRKIKVPIEQQKNAMNPIDPLRDAARKLAVRAKLYKEADLAAKMTDSVRITQNSTPTNLWSDYTNSKVMADFNTAFDTLSASIQKSRDELSIVLGYPVWTKLILHPEIKELIKYSQKAIITTDILAQALQVKEVLVGNAVKNSSAESVTPVTTNYIWGKHAWVMYRDSEPSLNTVSGLYTLNMPGIAGPWTIYRYWDQKQKSDYVEISYYYQQYVMAPQAIYWFNGAVA